MQAVGEVGAVPHQQLGPGLDGPHRVEVDLLAVLARGQVLLRCRVGGVDVAHPVGLALVQTIHKVLEVTFCIDLVGGEERERHTLGRNDISPRVFLQKKLQDNKHGCYFMFT